MDKIQRFPGGAAHGTEHPAFCRHQRNEHDIVLTAAGRPQPLLVQHTDYGERNVVQGVVLIAAATYILLNLIADVLYVLVNPRLRG
jgi:hypothetical protein